MILFSTELKSKHCGFNLSFEDFFLRLDKPTDRMYLFFYENFSALVLGKSLELEQEVYTHKIHPPIYRRISGGGSVSHAVGNLNYSLFLSLTQFPQFMNVSLSYEKILTAVKMYLGKQVGQQGYSDLAIHCKGTMRKFSGNAQCRKRGWILHHGTLLYSKKVIRTIPYYLKPPPKQPEYRRNRKHTDFMTNVLPCYNRSELMHKVRRGVADAFTAEMCALPKDIFAAQMKEIVPFQAERKSR